MCTLIRNIFDLVGHSQVTLYFMSEINELERRNIQKIGANLLIIIKTNTLVFLIN